MYNIKVIIWILIFVFNPMLSYVVPIFSIYCVCARVRCRFSSSSATKSLLLQLCQSLKATGIVMIKEMTLFSQYDRRILQWTKMKIEDEWLTPSVRININTRIRITFDHNLLTTNRRQEAVLQESPK